MEQRSNEESQAEITSDGDRVYPVTLPSVSTVKSADVESASSAVEGMGDIYGVSTAASIADSAFLYSDYTEKLRSMFPECKLF